MKLVIAPVEVLRARLTQAFEGWASQAPARSCALSGGSTALVFLGALGDAQVDWSRISLFWVDERAVPPEDPDSNYGMAHRVLLGALGHTAPRAFRMPAEQADLGEAAVRYDQVLARELRGGPLDLAILGVGEDGHICSLFPGHRALMAEGRVVAVDDAPEADAADLGRGHRAAQARRAAGRHPADEAFHAARPAVVAGRERDGLHRSGRWADVAANGLPISG
jgi:6-phosphogluconolactonase